MPLSILTGSSGMSLTQLVILLCCAWFANQGLAAFYTRHCRAMMWVLVGFGGYFLISLLRMLLTKPAWPPLDGPSRLLLSISCIGFVGWTQARARGFWIGICLSAIAAGIIAVVQCAVLGQDRAEGFTHHAITFGDLSLVTGLMALCSLSEFRKSRLALLPLAALFCGVLASLLSGSRGGWLALPLALIPLWRQSKLRHNKLFLYGGVLLVLILALTLANLEQRNNVIERISLVFSEIHQYYSLGNANTSIGSRLELWKASLFMFIEHPWLGVGRDAFDTALHTLMLQGKLQDSAALTFSSSHNDALHFLATGGLLDFSFLMIMYIGPLLFFTAMLRRPGQHAMPAALAGVVLVWCFILFGLTDVMFWLMAPKNFYAMMVCMLMGFCLSAQEPSPEPTA